MKLITVIGAILAPLAVWAALYSPNPSSTQKLFAGLGVSFLGLQLISRIDD